MSDETAPPGHPAPYAPKSLLFGGDYNPEQWSRQTWRDDIALMTRAKVNTVTLGVFSWASLEPREGEYDTEWLDDIVALLHEAAIGFFLATPTASPPPWFTLAHPDALPVRPDGVRLSHGSRDTYAISAPAYRHAAKRVARMLAERYGQHPGLRGWHIHNEYGTLDHGPHAADAFRRWLQDRYGDLDALNAAWYTAFWSQGYGSWNEITPPVATQYLHNPAQSVDFKRFSSDEMLAAFGEQRAEIEATGSDVPVTTNFMLPTWNHLEQWSWGRAQDVVSIDHYLDTTGPDGEAHVAYGSDLTRAWGGGAPWVLMEQNATGIRVGDRTFAKPADRMIRNSLGYIARGAQSSLFFQWRAGLGGSEQWHGALVPHTGTDGPAFDAVVRLGGILESISEITAPPANGPLIAADVAICWHAEGWWSLDTPHLPNDAVTYSDEVRATYRSFWRAGIPVDFVEPGSDLSRYRLVVAPALYSMSDETADWLRGYAEQGGRLVVSYLTGTVDPDQKVRPGLMATALRELLGIRIDGILPLDAGERLPLSNGWSAEEWSEHVTLDGAEAIVRHETGPLAGRPAITSTGSGDGTAVYVSTRLEQSSRDSFFAEQARLAGAAPTLPGAVDLGVEAVRRRGAHADYLFLLHHGDAPVEVVGGGTELVSGTVLSDGHGLVLEAGGVAVIRLSEDESAAVQASRSDGEPTPPR